MEGNYKTANVIVKVAVPSYYDKSEENTKTESCVYRALNNQSAGFAPHGKVISIDVSPNKMFTEKEMVAFARYCRDSDNYDEAKFQIKKSTNREEQNDATEENVIEDMLEDFKNGVTLPEPEPAFTWEDYI